MNSFVSLFSGAGGEGGGGAKSAGSTGLLSDWNDYSTAHSGGGGDLESNTSSIFASTSKRVESAGSSVLNLVTSAGTSGLSKIQSSTSNTFLPSQKQWTYFAVFMASGLFFLSLALFVMLPMLVLAPAKFATSFTLGCVCVMASFFALRGWKQQLVHMLGKERLPFTGAYLGSILGTLYSSLWLHSYLMSIFFSGVQVFALLYYVSSYFPGGASGVKLLVSSVYSGFMNLLGLIFNK